MNDFCDIFVFIERDVIVEIFSVSEMCLFFIKLFVHRIIHFDMFFCADYVIIFFWTRDRKRRLHSWLKTSLFCLFSCFKLCKSVRRTISTLLRSFCFCDHSFATRKACRESSLSCWCVELWLITKSCLICLIKLWIWIFWRQNNLFYWVF